jgi:hypothetical protein
MMSIDNKLVRITVSLVFEALCVPRIPFSYFHNLLDKGNGST